MEASTAPQIFNDIDQWLDHHGFKYHPFEQLVADTDDNIASYFIEGFPYFQEIQKSGRCSFLFLDRGAGKSASRKMIANECDKSLKYKNNRRLAIHYTDFHQLIQKETVTLADHVDTILFEAVPRLYRYIAENDFTDQFNTNNEYAKEFAWFIINYSEWLSPNSVKRQLLEISNEAEKQELLKNTLWKPVAKTLGSVAAQSFPGGKFLVEPILALLSHEPAKRDDVPEITHSPLDVMARFAELAAHVGISHIYILIDRVDEYAHIYDYERATDILKPLIATIPLLEMPPYTFKFFLPTPLHNKLRSHLRSDRFDVYTYTWKPDELIKMFEARLLSATDEKKNDETQRKSFSRLFAETERPDEDKLLAEMIQFADKSPRNFLKLGKMIFDLHSRASSFAKLISIDTYTMALEKFAEEQLEQRAIDDPLVSKLQKLDLTNHHSLEDLLQRDLDLPKPSVQLVKQWEQDHFYAPHFSLIDIISSLNVPEAEARDMAAMWQREKHISVHYKIENESLKRYLFTKKTGRYKKISEGGKNDDHAH